MCCSAADTHLKPLDRVVSGARFLTVGVFECDIAHRQSVAVLCILYKIRCNPMHPSYGALPVPYVPVQATRGGLVEHLYTYAPPRCRTSQYCMTFILVSVERSCCPCIRWRETGGFQEQGQYFFICLSCSIPFCPTVFLFLFFLDIGWYCGAWVFRLYQCKDPRPTIPTSITPTNQNHSLPTLHCAMAVARGVQGGALAPSLSYLIVGKNRQRLQ